MNKKGSTNKGDKLFPARQRFIKMLIDEARDVLGLSFSELDRRLEIIANKDQENIFQNINTNRYYSGDKSPAPLRKNLQLYERYFAELLGRSENILVIVVDNSAIKVDLETYFPKTKYYLNEKGVNFKTLKKPISIKYFDHYEIIFKAIKSDDFEIGYEGGRPTYGEIKKKIGSFRICENLNDSGYKIWPEYLKRYDWQWRHLWEKKIPWLNISEFGYSSQITIELFIENHSKQQKKMSLWSEYAMAHPYGRKCFFDAYIAFHKKDYKNGFIKDFIFRVIGAYLSQKADFKLSPAELDFGRWRKRLKYREYEDIALLDIISDIQGLNEDEIHGYIFTNKILKNPAEFLNIKSSGEYLV